MQRIKELRRAREKEIKVIEQKLWWENTLEETAIHAYAEYL